MKMITLVTMKASLKVAKVRLTNTQVNVISSIVEKI